MCFFTEIRPRSRSCRRRCSFRVHFLLNFSMLKKNRNQRMVEDQSVVGRRRLYYDQHGSEVLICSDSEEELTEPEEDKHEFINAANQILWEVKMEMQYLNEQISFKELF